ncbi:hypothetical protein BBJ28_00015527 [Nothophytophthora sp. Chile5]|nr:hypothetical protein BBJ28_00015527 [Nothophytophthora sp. Chile5]
MTLFVTPVVTPDELKQVMALRMRVFIQEKGMDYVETDDNDEEPSTIHFLGRDMENNKFVAVARCLLDVPKRKAQIGRVAVLAECRGKGYGVQLMNAIEDHVRDRVDSFVLSAQLEKKGFYTKCGYHCTSDDVYLEKGVEHCWMTKLANP